MSHLRLVLIIVLCLQTFYSLPFDILCNFCLKTGHVIWERRYRINGLAKGDFTLIQSAVALHLKYVVAVGTIRLTFP